MNIREKLQKGKETPAFRLFRVDGYYSDHCNIELQVCYLDEKNEPGFYNNYCDEKRQFKDVYVRCCLSRDFPAPYGFELAVTSHRKMTLADAEKVVATLKPIQKKLDKIESLEGSPQSFEEYALRAVRVLEIGAYWPAPTKTRTYHVSHDMRFFRHELSNLIKEIQESFGQGVAA